MVCRGSGGGIRVVYRGSPRNPCKADSRRVEPARLYRADSTDMRHGIELRSATAAGWGGGIRPRIGSLSPVVLVGGFRGPK